MKKAVLIAISNLVFVLAIGTVAYHHIEGWSWADSFFFVGMHIATIGTAALEPSNDISKIFTVFLSFAGVVLGFYSLTILAISYFKNADLSVWRTLTFGFAHKKKDKDEQ